MNPELREIVTDEVVNAVFWDKEHPLNALIWLRFGTYTGSKADVRRQLITICSDLIDARTRAMP